MKLNIMVNNEIDIKNNMCGLHCDFISAKVMFSAKENRNKFFPYCELFGVFLTDLGHAAKRAKKCLKHNKGA